ncbi:DUF2254 domain-containing protein [Aquimarina agarivorans]|uniref:DUF2254 domain-containing protein n=1 Tax=Aquimarina agarivorans TaxID=980584 RepID=UPI000248FAD8|nr:DUF2254 family protein [Aquimarina agarivorans]
MIGNSIFAQRLLQQIKIIFQNVYKSIAFYPVLIASFFLLLGLSSVLITFDITLFGSLGWTKILFVKNKDSASTILTSIAGGEISLMVFSFSMVMVVLNQASSNFSPRVLPNLIADRGHQSILGFYAGSIIFTFIILLGLGSGKLAEPNIAIGVIIAFFFMILSIGCFVFFIHNISKSIQLKNIVEQLKNKTIILIDKRSECKPADFGDQENWHTIYSDHTGFFHGIIIQFTSDYFNKDTHHVKVIPCFNDYIREGDPVLKIKEDVPDKEINSLKESILINPTRYNNENIENNLIKLKEIGLKAMSPGINDPGTMLHIITAIETLMQKIIPMEFEVERVNKGNKIKLLITEIDKSLLIDRIYIPIFQYSKNDLLVLEKLSESITHLNHISNDSKIISALLKIKKNVQNSIDQLKRDITSA